MRPPIPRLNYQHLLYFWSVVRNGSLTKACTELHLSAPTVSAQLRTFEERLGSRLLMKSGRTLVPTEAGRLVFSYAEEIFALGADLLNALRSDPTQKPMRVVAGIDDVVPKEIAQQLVNAALNLEQPVQLMCREGILHELLKALELRELDVVLSGLARDAEPEPARSRCARDFRSPWTVRRCCCRPPTPPFVARWTSGSSGTRCVR